MHAVSIPTGGFTPGADSVTVSLGTSVSSAARFFVEQAAVTGTVTKTASEGTSPIGSVGAVTDSPDLVSVTTVPGASFEFDFTFDQAVSSGSAADFYVYKNDAHKVAGASIVNVIDNNTVLVDFSGSGLNQHNVSNVTLGAVDQGAASNAATGLANTVGSELVRPSH
ncbi:MAG: hypothetical protein ACRDX8_05295 [Acidimicrobiales bacterium]